MSTSTNPTVPATTTGNGTASMATSPAKAGSNAAAMKQAWLDKSRELGERKGGGTAAEL